MEKTKTIPPTVKKQTFLQRYQIFKQAIFLSFLFFLILSFFAKLNPYFPFDLTITRFIQSINLPLFDKVMAFLTIMGNTPFWFIEILTVSVFGLALKEIKEGVLIAVSGFGAVWLSVVIKEIIGRPRPSSSLVNLLETHPMPDSFPSGHVLFFVGFYGFLLFLSYTKLKKGLGRTLLIYLFSSLIILISFSRIYVGAHWFSDTLGSYLIGYVWLYFMSYIYKKIQVDK